MNKWALLFTLISASDSIYLPSLKVDSHENLNIFRVFILATVVLIIVATVYENKLIQKGFDFNDDKEKAEKDAERLEMNRINSRNNNNDENGCEMYSKIHQERNSQKLGEIARKENVSFKIIAKFFTKVLKKVFQSDVTRRRRFKASEQ